jgi:hypothetical protein
MTKILAITPSFTAWRRAADKLLTLETSLALRKRNLIFGPIQPKPAEELEIEQVRELAGQLFEVVRAETDLVRAHAHAQAPAPPDVAGKRPAH